MTLTGKIRQKMAKMLDSKAKMSISARIWDKLGELPEDETLHMHTRLFTAYEKLYEKAPKNPEPLNFFKNLDNAIEQTIRCNLNRR